MTNDLFDRARAWVDADVDANDQAALTALIDAGDVAALTAVMGRDLTFGTAGLRAPMGPGSNRMNRATVIRTTFAVTRWLHDRHDGPVSVVVGFDARHNSQQFATDAIGVLLAVGITVHQFGAPVPTPLVAFAQQKLAAQAAIVITASHNPAADNGYKLYGDGAAQIVTPDDETIQGLLARAPGATLIARHTGPSELLFTVDVPIAAAYERMVVELHTSHSQTRPTIVYTPLHGVGAKTFLSVAKACGYDTVHVVESQAQPDPDFPTVSFPNPEEPGALDLALHKAQQLGVDLVLANDPDADRLAVAVPDGDGSFVALSGNQIGVLLADYLLEQSTADKKLIVTTVVSTPMVNALARRHDATVERTFTGFKWIARAASELRQAGHSFVYGFEEALGSNVTAQVNDKDGISAAIVFADLVTWLAHRGETVLERLATLAVLDGVWVSRQVSVTRDGLDGANAIKEAMARLQADPPDMLGTRRVVSVNDYTSGGDTRPFWRGEDLLVELVFADGRILVRPSGTEPKLKAYVDLRFDVDSREDVAAVTQQGEREAKQLAQLLLTQIGIV